MNLFYVFNRGHRGGDRMVVVHVFTKMYHCLSPLMLKSSNPDTTLCDKVCQ